MMTRIIHLPKINMLKSFKITILPIITRIYSINIIKSKMLTCYLINKIKI